MAFKVLLMSAINCSVHAFTRLAGNDVGLAEKTERLADAVQRAGAAGGSDRPARKCLVGRGRRDGIHAERGAQLRVQRGRRGGLLLFPRSCVMKPMGSPGQIGKSAMVCSARIFAKL